MQVSDKLIKRCQSDDRKAQFELYQECYAPLMQVALRYQKNLEDAQSLVNQGMLKVFQAIEKGKYNPSTPFGYWARRIMINTVIDEYRKIKREREHELQVENVSNWSQDSEPELNSADLEMEAENLRNLIRQLPELSQKVFNLCVLDGYEYSEVATLLSITESTVRWHIHNSRSKLKVMINNATDLQKRMVL